MSHEEVFLLVKSIRFERRQVPQKKGRKTPARAKKPPSEASILANLTPEQRQELLKELGG
jgi:hypothetical protein